MKNETIILKIIIIAMLTVIISTLVWFATSFAVNIQSYIANVPKDDKVHFLKMKTSDSILVESNGEYGLIDASYDKDDPLSLNKNSNGAVVLDYLNKNGVKHLKFVILTHPHSDHAGGIPEIVYNSNLVDENTTFIYKDALVIPSGEEEYYKHQIGYYKTSNVSIPGADDSAEKAKQAMKSKKAVMLDTLSIDKSSLKKLKAKVSDDKNIWDRYITFQMGDLNIKIYNISFYVETVNNEPYVDINSNSLVTLITSKNGYKVLTMADATVRHKSEIYYGELIGKVDIFKANHHGISYSNSTNLIDAIRPTYAVVTNSPTNKLAKGFVAPYVYIKNYGGKVYYTGESEVVFNLTNKLYIEKGKEYTDIFSEDWYEWYHNIDDKNKKGLYYIRDNEFLTGLQKINNNTYLLDDNGMMLTGWQVIDNKLYYFEPKNETNLGKLYINKTTTINGHKYKFDKNGVCESSRCKTVLKSIKQKTN